MGISKNTDNIRQIVFFLGSGFAYSVAGYPRQESFLREVLTEERRDWVLQPLPEKERNQMHRLEDPELLLSYFYHMDSVTREEEPERRYKKCIINFRMAMNEFFRGFDAGHHDKPESPTLRRFRETVRSLAGDGTRVDFITTNYDLSLERTLELDQPGRAAACFGSDERTTHRIIKLHGSVNWLEERNIRNGEVIGFVDKKSLVSHLNANVADGLFEKGIQPELPSDRDPGTTLRVERDLSSNVVYCSGENGERIYTPVTIPFFYQKNDWYSHRWEELFRDLLWKDAANLLAEADTLVFIGFGFHGADYPVLGLVNRAPWWEKRVLNIGNCEHFSKVGIRLDLCSGRYLQDFGDGELYRFLQDARSIKK